MIIGFCGKIGAGKDTAGAYLVEQYGFERISFAAKLKESAAACFGIDPASWETLKNDELAKVKIEGPYLEYANITVRQFLQHYGTEAHRSVFGDDFWIEQALKDVDPNKRYVVTDVRFQNEAIAIKDYSGWVIQIDRGEDAPIKHVSEGGIPDFLLDGKVANIGTVEKLHILLDALVERANA